MDYSGSNVDVAAEKLKHGSHTHIFDSAAAQKISTISTVSRWAPKIKVPNSVSDLPLFLSYRIMTRKVWGRTS